jgi:hypothetical protein
MTHFRVKKAQRLGLSLTDLNMPEYLSDLLEWRGLYLKRIERLSV